EDGIRYATVTGVQTCALPISRSQKFAVRAEGHARGEGIAVPTGPEGEDEEFLAGLRIPHLHPPVASAGQTLAVWAEGHGKDSRTLETKKFLTRVRIPHFHRDRVALPRAAGQAFAVRAESHALSSLDGDKF